MKGEKDQEISMRYAVLLILGCLVSCSGGDQKKTDGRQAVTVSLAEVEEKSVPYVIESIGNTGAYASVSITPQVSGELIKVSCHDGCFVNKGDLLFSIDPRPYEAALEEAEGQYAQAKANLSYQEHRVKRYKELASQNFVSPLTYESYISELQSAEGQLKCAEGAVRSAKVNLGFCKIYAPLSGRLGRRVFDEGNVVSPQEKDPLIVINQISPIYVLFTVPEKFFPEIQKYSKENKLVVDISVVGEEKTLFSGVMDFIDNTVDAKTGSLLLRAHFPNQSETLWPGQFVHVTLKLYTIPQATLVPEEAIVRDAKGPFLFVAKEDGTVDQRRVKLGQLLQHDQVVQEGIQRGEKVVLDGQLSLFQGAHYSVAKQ